LRRSKKSKGFSLIEVLIALVILSISLLALAGLMGQSTRNSSWGSHLTEAATLAQDRLERFRAVRPQTDIPEGINNDLITGVTGIVYTRTWTVTTNASSTARTITITITWTDSIPHSITIMHPIAI
jgi:prepilin-type N-terminal cleavage/methylation domain-containing protein